ncbi:hypothetical protein GCM10010528_15860 [Gordonia defluvii]|jgi:nucleotide-binding universal stress UspA family protein|uniref:UspA domain-containing protein n=1 Tax=Gordonia defluvii TaxID=283718 RepID=A0ABP6L9S1_9ACTN|nr:universal stress protein [Gordonia sp. UBA5067]
MAISSFSGRNPGRTDVNLVVGWDRSPTSSAALREAVDLARRLHARLHIAHIADDSDLGIDPDSPLWEEQTRALRDSSALWVRALLADFGDNWTYHSGRGSAVGVLRAVATKAGATIIVIGAHRRGLPGVLSRLTRRPLLPALLAEGFTVVIVPPAR